ITAFRFAPGIQPQSITLNPGLNEINQFTQLTGLELKFDLINIDGLIVVSNFSDIKSNFNLAVQMTFCEYIPYDICFKLQDEWCLQITERLFQNFFCRFMFAISLEIAMFRRTF